MARLRTIKFGFFTNETLTEVAPVGRLLFAALWCLADREGRLEDRPRRIKGAVFPYEDVDVDGLLDQLAERGFVLRYAVNGDRYVQVVNFLKHQRPHHKETASAIPPPPSHDLGASEHAPKDGASTDLGASNGVPGHVVAAPSSVFCDNGGNGLRGVGSGERGHDPADSEAVPASPRPGGAEPRPVGRGDPPPEGVKARPRRSGGSKRRDGPSLRGWPAPTYVPGQKIDGPSAFEDLPLAEPIAEAVG